MSPAMSTETTSPYTAMIPDMTTGIRHYVGAIISTFLHIIILLQRTFMIKSGLNVPTPAIPIPAFAVPYAAPIANSIRKRK